MPACAQACALASSSDASPAQFAAREGHIEVVDWLLANGAAPSLRLRNKMGHTPLQMAQLFGPYPEVEAAILNFLHPLPSRGRQECRHKLQAQLEMDLTIGALLTPAQTSAPRKVLTSAVAMLRLLHAPLICKRALVHSGSMIALTALVSMSISNWHTSAKPSLS